MHARVFKFHVWIPHEKIAGTYFFPIRIMPLFSSPEHEVLMVSYCGQSMSVVHRALSVVCRAASTIALKAYSSYTPWPIDSILGRKHWADL